MRTKDPWYELVSGSDVLMQGDLLENCPTAELYRDKNDRSLKGIANIMNVVVLSQSCELAEAQAESFMVCHYVPLSTFEEKLQSAGANSDSIRNAKSDLGKDRRVGYHALNRCVLSGHEMPEPIVVDFHNIYGVPLDILRAAADAATNGRLRLCPPYREHLSQAFGQFFMKVALPVGYYNPIGEEHLPPEDTVVGPGAEAART
jgi:hypothetical protein